MFLRLPATVSSAVGATAARAGSTEAASAGSAAAGATAPAAAARTTRAAAPGATLVAAGGASTQFRSALTRRSAGTARWLELVARGRLVVVPIRSLSDPAGCSRHEPGGIEELFDLDLFLSDELENGLCRALEVVGQLLDRRTRNGFFGFLFLGHRHVVSLRRCAPFPDSLGVSCSSFLSDPSVRFEWAPGGRLHGSGVFGVVDSRCVVRTELSG